ncbi:MAG: hypothetical protein H6623_08425 [Bdellovibrionaceae bacterium]|nr:hypothetical protein [Pseudobdellovibrionaceae bacterium]
MSTRDLASNEENGVNYPPDTFENGFVNIDVLEPIAFNRKKDPNKQKTVHPIMFQHDLDEAHKSQLKSFRPLMNFKSKEEFEKLKKAGRLGKGDLVKLPWLDKNIDVRDSVQAELLSKILQRYVYEGWFDQDRTENKTDLENQFRENSYRTWCHTPWLNITEKGREAIHGLTKEFPIRNTSVYHNVPEEIERGENAVTWGLAFFNQNVCQNYDTFFTEEHMIQQMRERKPVFDAGDGAVSFKLLFNTMPDWDKAMAGEWTGSGKNSEVKAYNWFAHVSHDRKDSIRHIANVAHVQMDIGLRDSRLIGTQDDLKNWVMTTFYFDPNYHNEFLDDMKIPEALRHMRPVGLQYGLDVGESIIFAGANNNHRPDGITELPYDKTRLNGPVDNIKSSCLGCHAASGMNFGLPVDKNNQVHPSAPGLGFLTKEDYLRYRKMANGGNYDFNMQLDKSMRNFSKSKDYKIKLPEIQK